MRTLPLPESLDWELPSTENGAFKKFEMSREDLYSRSVESLENFEKYRFSGPRLNQNLWGRGQGNRFLIST